jgi:hypothetical protein
VRPGLALPERLRLYIASCTYQTSGCYASRVIFPEHNLGRGVKGEPCLQGDAAALFVGVIRDGPEPLFVLWDASRIGRRGSGTSLLVDADMVAMARKHGYAAPSQGLYKGRGDETAIVTKAEHMVRALQERLRPEDRQLIFSALGIDTPPPGALALGAAVIPVGGHAVRLHVHDRFNAGETKNCGKPDEDGSEDGDAENTLDRRLWPFSPGGFERRVQEAPSALAADDPRSRQTPRDVILAMDADRRTAALWDAARYDPQVPQGRLTVLKQTLAEAADAPNGIAVERQLLGNTGKVIATRYASLPQAMDLLLAHPPASGRTSMLVDPEPQRRLAQRLALLAPIDADYRPMHLRTETDTGVGWTDLDFFLLAAVPTTQPEGHYVASFFMPGWGDDPLSNLAAANSAPPVIGAWLDATPERFPGFAAQRLYAFWDPYAQLTLPVADRRSRIRLMVSEKTVHDALASPAGIATQPRRLANGVCETVVVCTEAQLQAGLNQRLRTMAPLPREPLDQTGWQPVALRRNGFDWGVAVYGQARPEDYVLGTGRLNRSLHEWIVRNLPDWRPGQRVVAYVPQAAETGVARALATVLNVEAIGPRRTASTETGLAVLRAKTYDHAVLSAPEMMVFAPLGRRPGVPLRFDGRGRLARPDGAVVKPDELPGLLGRLTENHAEYCAFEVGDGAQIVIPRSALSGAGFVDRVNRLREAGVPIREMPIFGELPAVVFPC